MPRCITDNQMFSFGLQRFGDTGVLRTDFQDAQMCFRQLWLFSSDYSDFVASERCERTAEIFKDISGICGFSFGLQRFGDARALRIDRQYAQMHHRYNARKLSDPRSRWPGGLLICIPRRPVAFRPAFRDTVTTGQRNG